jgi:hypothetical protein
VLELTRVLRHAPRSGPELKFRTSILNVLGCSIKPEPPCSHRCQTVGESYRSPRSGERSHLSTQLDQPLSGDSIHGQQGFGRHLNWIQTIAGGTVCVDLNVTAQSPELGGCE